MRRAGGGWVRWGVVVVVMVVAARQAAALPPFARKYRTSCATCHESYPRLNGVGEAFRLNGFKFADDEMYIKEEPVELADEAYKKVWPGAIWPSDIPGLPPLTIGATFDYNWDIGHTNEERTEFIMPKEAQIFGAGSLGDSMSAFIELNFSRVGGHHGGIGGGDEHGEEVSDETTTSLEGWVQFEDMFGPENAFNLRVGTVGMHEIGLFTARNHNRIGVEPYLYATWSVPGLDGHELEEFFDEETEFRGNGFALHAQSGVELNGFGRNWRYAVGIVNGDSPDAGDGNSEKDTYFQLAYKIGGLGFDGSGMDGLPSDQFWVDDSVTLSAFGYMGSSPVMVGTDMTDDDFWRLGVGVLWRHKDLQLGAGYVIGVNDHPYGMLVNDSLDSSSFFVETQYFLYPWLVPYARFEALDLDMPEHDVVLESNPDGGDQSRVVIGAKMLLRANVSLTVEGRFYTTNEPSLGMGGHESDDNMIVTSLRVMF